MSYEMTLNPTFAGTMNRQETAVFTAQKLFNQQVSRSFFDKVKSLFGYGDSHLNHEPLMAETNSDQQTMRSQTVALEQICGSSSLGRSTDFDADFRPLNRNTESRWISIAAARKIGKRLPNVQLVQKGNAYFVIDGHHRISVAQAFGDSTIAANVTICH